MASDPFTDALGRRRGVDRDTPHSITVTNPLGEDAHSGRSFTLRVVLRGEAYGRGKALTHDEGAPLVEVFDAAYAGREGFEGAGQRVGCYRLSTLLGYAGSGEALDLRRGKSAWRIDGEALGEARAWMTATL